MQNILRLFPRHLTPLFKRIIKDKWHTLQEIRIRINQPVEFIFNDASIWLKEHRITKIDCDYLIEKLSEYSLYRLENELREGYITIAGGHRVGIAGKVTTVSGKVQAIQDITFFNIRIAKEIIGATNQWLSYLYHDNQIQNTLIIGSPQTGKTTFIRDLARILSSGSINRDPLKISIIDERSEIAASVNGIPQNNVGLRTDVLDACPKAEGLMMMIRSMSPELIIVDEIGSKKDVQALLEAINAGVRIICTIHGNSIQEIKQRPLFTTLFTQKVFQRYFLLDRGAFPNNVAEIYDENEFTLYKLKKNNRGIRHGLVRNNVVNRY